MVIHDLYECKVGQTVIFTDKIIENIRKLVSSRSDESGYTPSGIMLQWRYVDNKHLFLKKEFHELIMYLQFICMIGTMTDEFKKKHNVEYHHEALLRRLYLSNDEDKGDFVVTTAFKRPFGNSSVSWDVAEEMESTVKITGKQEYDPFTDKSREEINESFVSEEYFKFLDILDNFIKEFEIDFLHFRKYQNSFGLTKKFDWKKYLQPKFGNHRGHSYLSDWEIDIAGLRNFKLSKLLETSL